MLKRLLAVLTLVLIAAAATAQPNLSYSFLRDGAGRPSFGIGLRPVVTAEMGIPPGTPFFDRSTNALYYWSGSAWTAQAPTVNTSSVYVYGSGPGTLENNTTGTQNVAFGTNALRLNQTGTHNVAFGAYTLEANVSNSGNAAFGTNALKVATADYNTAFGTQALALNTTGASNTVMGYNAASKITEGSNNVVLGVNGLANAAQTTSGVVVIGTTAAYSATGDNNIVLGKEAGYRSGAVQDPGNALTTGANNTFLGYRSGLGSATQRSNATAVGAEAYVDASNTVALGDENVTDVLMGSAKQANVGATTVTLEAILFAALGTPGNGAFKFCSDCTIASPCAAGGSGALAKRLNGAWVCN